MSNYAVHVLNRLAENAVFHDIPSRGLTPQSASPFEAWPEVLPSPVDSDEEAANRDKGAGRGKARSNGSPGRSWRHRDRSTDTSTSSNYCPPLARESSNGGTKKDLFQSPLSSPRRVLSYDNNYSYISAQGCDDRKQAFLVSPKKSRQLGPSYDDDEFSEMTTRERAAEREIKRVTFRSASPNSFSSLRSGYKSDAAKNFLRRKTSWGNSEL